MSLLRANPIWLLYPGLVLVVLALVAIMQCGVVLGLGAAVVGVAAGRAAASWVKRPSPSGRWIPDDPSSRRIMAFVVFLGWWMLLRVVSWALKSWGYDSGPAMSVVWAVWIVVLMAYVVATAKGPKLTD